MGNRALWQSIMHYGEFDRMPVIHWTGWPETTERWEGEGMPAGVNQQEYFDAIPFWTSIGAQLQLHPAFEEETLEDTPEYRIFRASDGVVQQDWKHQSCIPHYIDFTLKSSDDWDEYKKRLQPDPARLPDDLDAHIRAADERDLPITITTASMMGWIRNWMGVENMSYLMFDAPDCYADMVDTLADLTCWSLDQILPRARELGVVPDMGFGWEDICGKSGPLVSPDIFDRAVAKGYRRIRDKLDSHGVHLYGLDSDGDVRPLLSNWMDSGVNVMFPLEPGTWGATPEEARQQYGKELRVIGGYDKLALERGRDAIDEEFDRHLGLARTGGLVLMPDHLITPGTPLDDYKYYLEKVRNLRF